MPRSRNSHNLLSVVAKFGKYMPEDLLVHILILLPVKSLVRLRCVCKLWFLIINSDSFRNAHLKISKKYLLFEHSSFYSLHSEQSSIYKSIKIIRHHYTPESLEIDTSNGGGLMIYGSCNGVLCLSDCPLKYDSLVCLWNPMIRKAKKISSTPNCAKSVVARLCFGYYDDDYKVIKLGFVEGMLSFLSIYSLRTDSWKIIDDTHFGNVRHLESVYCPTALLVNGAAYFRFWRSQIICFDLLEERVREIQCPEKYSWWGCNGLEAYGDSLVAFTENSSGFLSMWVLKKCDKPCSSWWEKKLTIDLAVASYPLGFIESGEYMFRSRGDFYSYNLEIPRSNRIIFRLKLRNLLRVQTYVESLVLLDEKAIGPFTEPEPCSCYPTFTLHKNDKAPDKKRKLEERKMQKD